MSLDKFSSRQRYVYAHGYRTLDQAQDALEDSFAAGEISLGEFPLVETYTLNGRRFYRITLAN